ncbi:MAG: DoxX family protein [archaeon]
MCKEFFKKHGDVFYALFRIFFGFLFFQHGAQKIFGYLGATAQATGSFMWFVGIFETLIGLAIALGVLTRLAATGGAIIMISAFFKAHAWPMMVDPDAIGFFAGLNPLLNRGELAILYLFAFILMIAYGGKRWMLENALWKKELI